MTRHPYPPHDFECLYRHTCPYLDGLSTTWVLGEYRRADNVYHEHLRIIDDFYHDLKARDNRIRVLERENAELKAKLQALHQRQFKPNKKKDAEDIEGAALSKEGKKKRGAPVGHPGWVRPKPDRIDRTVNVPAPTFCPHCQSDDLAPMEESMDHFQEDIVIRPRIVVTRYLHGQAFCARCNHPVVQAGAGELLNAPIGPVAKSVAVYLRYRMGIPYRKTAELFRELFGLKVVPASALGFDRKAAARGAPIYEDLRQKIRASDVVHADETSWRSDGVGQKLKSGAVPWEAAAKIEKRFVTKLSNICKQPLRFKPAETLRAYLAGPEQKFLFTFLRRPGVPPTNNHAEQSLRHLEGKEKF